MASPIERNIRAATDRSSSALRSPSTLGARPSVTGIADRISKASQEALAELAAQVAKLQAENTALRGDIKERDSRLEEAAAVSQAAARAYLCELTPIRNLSRGCITDAGLAQLRKIFPDAALTF